MIEKISTRLKHFFHVVSNIRPIVWIALYVALVPVFALIYWWLPDSQFRIPDSAGTDFGSWVYYSIVTITTLGFGDYTPAHGWAQAVTAVEVMCGLIFLGFFLNAVGSMRSEIDVESELEKQRRVHEATETEKLLRNIPVILHKLNLFMAYCYAVTTPLADRTAGKKLEFDPDFSFSDMRDLYKPSHIPADRTMRPAVEGLLRSSADTSLFLDSLQTRIDMTLWPDLLNECFAFVAECQMFSSTDAIVGHPQRLARKMGDVSDKVAETRIADSIQQWKGGMEISEDNPMNPFIELSSYIRDNGSRAAAIEASLSEIAAKSRRQDLEVSPK